MKRRVGAARSRRRGLGPARLDGQALRATVAGKSDELGERRRAADGPGAALNPTPRGKRPCVPKARLDGWMAVGRSGATCSAALQGRQTQCGGDGLHSRSPGGQTQCAGVSRPQGGNDGSPRGARRNGGSMPRTTARPGDAGRHKDNSDRIAELPKCDASGICRLTPEANDGEHLQPSSGRVATAAVRPDGTDGRTAAWPGRPLSCRVPSLSRGHYSPSLIQPVKP